jgi:hypothetical protein
LIRNRNFTNLSTLFRPLPTSSSRPTARRVEKHFPFRHIDGVNSRQKKKKNEHNKKIFYHVGGGAGRGSGANGAVITVPNFSFESPAQTISTGSGNGNISDWTASGTPNRTIETFYPAAASALQAKDGNQRAYIIPNAFGTGTVADYGTLTQALTLGDSGASYALAANSIYTFSVWLAPYPTNGAFSNTTLTLSAGASTLAQTFIGQTSWNVLASTPTWTLDIDGKYIWQQFSVIYNSGSDPTGIGSAITLGLRADQPSGTAGFTAAEFDSVTLDVIPEPVTWWLFSGAGAFLITLRRRRP